MKGGYSTKATETKFTGGFFWSGDETSPADVVWVLQIKLKDSADFISFPLKRYLNKLTFYYPYVHILLSKLFSYNNKKRQNYPLPLHEHSLQYNSGTVVAANLSVLN